MIDFDFSSTTRIVFGKDSEEKVGDLILSYGYKRVLVVYGGNSAVKSGLLGRVEKNLKDHGIVYFELGGVRPNPDKELVKTGKKMVFDGDIEFLLAIGGGSVIDTAKSIAVNRYYDGDVMYYHTGKATPNKAMPIGVILTIAAAGSESSDSAVLSDTENKIKSGFHSDLVRPVFAISHTIIFSSLL